MTFGPIIKIICFNNSTTIITIKDHLILNSSNIKYTVKPAHHYPQHFKKILHELGSKNALLFASFENATAVFAFLLKIHRSFASANHSDFSNTIFKSNATFKTSERQTQTHTANSGCTR